MNARQEAIAWAKDVCAGSFVVLDTETTGLHDGEIVQIAIINQAGRVLLDTLVKPVYRIPPDATAIHGITNAQVRNAPGWSQVYPEVNAICSGQTVVIYNADYDLRMIRQSCEAASITPRHAWATVCAMEWYAQFYGDWNDYRRSFRWQKLTSACRHQNIDEDAINAPAHSALGDCLRTLAVVSAMAAG